MDGKIRNGEGRRVYIGELVKNFKRSELDGLAMELRLNPGQYSNKTTLAEAILNVREREAVAAATAAGAAPEPVPIEGGRSATRKEEVAGVTSRSTPSTVRSMRESILGAAAETKIYNARFLGNVNDLVKMNMEAAENIRSYVKEFQRGIQEIVKGIEERAKEHGAYIRQFYG